MPVKLALLTIFCITIQSTGKVGISVAGYINYRIEPEADGSGNINCAGDFVWPEAEGSGNIKDWFIIIYDARACIVLQPEVHINHAFYMHFWLQNDAAQAFAS